MGLTALAIRNAKPRTKPYKLADARDKRDAARKMIADGIDSSAEIPLPRSEDQDWRFGVSSRYQNRRDGYPEKTGRPVQFELTADVRGSLLAGSKTPRRKWLTIMLSQAGSNMQVISARDNMPDLLPAQNTSFSVPSSNPQSGALITDLFRAR